MCFQSKLHPNVKQNRRDEPTHRCFQNRIPTNCQQWHHCAAERSSSTAAVSDQTKQQGRAKMKPRHQIRQQGGREREGGEGMGMRAREEGRMKKSNCGAVMKVTKKLLCLAFESITVVWLSSYRSLSVNAVSPISHKRVCMCVCVCRQETVITVTLSQCDSFSHLFSLPLSFSLILSVRSRSLPAIDVSIPPCALRRSQHSLLQKTSVKWKGTDNKRVMELRREKSEKEKD